MKCAACGGEVPDDAGFCSHCGVRLTGTGGPGTPAYDRQWDIETAVSDGSDFHSEDTIIPDFTPPASRPGVAPGDTRSGLAATPASAPGASAGGRRTGPMLVAAALALLLVAAAIYHFSAGNETIVVAQAPVSPAAVSGSEPSMPPSEHVDPAVAGVGTGDSEPPAMVPAGEVSPQAEEAVQTATPAAAAATSKPEPRMRPKDTAQRKAPPPAVQSPPPAPVPKGGTEGTRPWLAALREDLAACERESFFPRIACREKARWKHCAPDHWNAVPECKASAGIERPGQNP
ncbi:zinc ribbon domain-containing protein [Azoarcus sp. L1K30]|uniref:zinc ribbon domain-containing protein n=1 Tax=Azoarcus sp. L1K30 TaxID=2820277 RepID=UPI001B819C5E|nr:zinc ribbon domain-containing protein [Azoarcus sp. L1K30]MBR0567600.1 zinc ribbon domain-containing protein [Azoarcus sp. L1K30]